MRTMFGHVLSAVADRLVAEEEEEEEEEEEATTAAPLKALSPNTCISFADFLSAVKNKLHLTPFM